MTNDELNHYIKHYIEKDHTGRAIMLTGAWGMGKSYYIKNCLIPFLANPKNGERKCIVVSLYGIATLSEVSKAIYLESRVKRINPETETGKAALLAAKTVLKGIAGHFGVDLNVDENGLQELYESIDLTDKLIIFEDVERGRIGILDFLGYVNSLVEQDGVKVLLVANEAELLKYKPIDKQVNAPKEIDANPPKEKDYTEETIRYLEIKEKTIGDTISFEGDLVRAVKQIIQSFNDKILNRFASEECAADIVDIMVLMNSSNLRSVIFACQKTADIYEFISDDGDYSDDFIKTIFYGIVFFSFRIHAGSQVQWTGLAHYSLELGHDRFPLFRFCFDYIMEQRMHSDLIPIAQEKLMTFRLYDQSKTFNDPMLQILSGYYLHTEQEVQTAVKKITRRLSDPKDISFYDYGRIAVALIVVKYNLCIDIEETKKLLVSNLIGRGDVLKEEDLFWYALGDVPDDAEKEYELLRDDMISALNDGRTLIPGFDYLPEHVTFFKNYVVANRGSIYSEHGFCRYLDVDRMVNLFAHCTPAQMNDVRSVFLDLYRINNAKEIFINDLPALEELLMGIETTWERPDVDRVQLLQYKWFAENLRKIIDSLR